MLNRSMEVQFGIGKASLHRYFLRVIHALRDISFEVIRWPEGHNIDRIKNARVQCKGWHA